MSGVEILGAISATVALIETVIKLRKAYDEANDVPEAITQVLNRLPLIKTTLEQAAREAANTSISNPEVSSAVGNVVEACKQKAEQLEEIFTYIAPTPEASIMRKYRLIMRRVGKGKKVETLARSMMEDLTVLAQYWDIGESAEKEVDDAIEALSNVPASIDDAELMESNAPRSVFNNTGGGTFNLNQGDNGRIYSGDGMKNAETMYFGKDI